MFFSKTINREEFAFFSVFLYNYDIMNNISYIGKVVEVKMDRMLGSKHPKYGWTYETNYGFIPGTMAPDGEELDAYVLGVNEPLEIFKGKVIAVIHRTNNDDDKLVVVPEDVELSDEEIKKQTHYQEQWFESVVLRGNAEKEEDSK